MREEFALQLVLREVELHISSISQIRAAALAVLGLFLTLDALLVREALARNADNASIAKGFAGTLILTMVVFFLLMPRTIVAWPSGMSLLGGDRSTSDALRQLVSQMDIELAQVRHRTNLAYRRAFGAVLVSAGTVGLWLLILSSAEPASQAIQACGHPN